MDTRDELLQRTFDAERRINDAAALRKFTIFTVERIRMCNQTDDGHIEHLLN